MESSGQESRQTKTLARAGLASLLPSGSSRPGYILSARYLYCLGSPCTPRVFSFVYPNPAFPISLPSRARSSPAHFTQTHWDHLRPLVRTVRLRGAARSFYPGGLCGGSVVLLATLTFLTSGFCRPCTTFPTDHRATFKPLIFGSESGLLAPELQCGVRVCVCLLAGVCVMRP